jgi:transketolase
MVVVPAGPIETRAVIRAVHSIDGPVFVRTSRTPVPEVHDVGFEFEPGRADRLRDGTAATIITNGTLVAPSLVAAEALEREAIDVRVLNMSSVSPADTAAVVAAAIETGAIVVVEEHTVRGGLGGLVAEIVVEHHPVPVRLLGVPGVFAPTGSHAYLLDYFGLTPNGIADAVRATIARRDQ